MRRGSRIILGICIGVAAVIYSLHCFMELPFKEDVTTAKYETDFYVAFLQAISSKNEVLIADLVPVKWDTMKVFRAYSTKEDKFAYAEYRYANDIQDITHEDVISLMFMKDGIVVYYVDALVPRRFDIEMVDSSIMEVSLDGKYAIRIDSAYACPVTSWGYYPMIDEVSVREEPCFMLSNSEAGTVSVTLTTLR